MKYVVQTRLVPVAVAHYNRLLAPGLRQAWEQAMTQSLDDPDFPFVIFWVSP